MLTQAVFEGTNLMIARISLAASAFLLAVTLLAGFPSAAIAQTQELEATNFAEEKGKAAKISGARVVVGVVLKGEPTKRRPKVEALFPKSWSGQITCARWLTSDALYWAQTNYAVPEDSAATYFPLRYPTERSDLVGPLPLDRMAIAITRGACEADSLEFVPALWNATYAGKQGELLVLVNGRGAEEVFVLGGDGAIDVSCSAIADGSTLGFDHACAIAVSVGETILQLQVNRIRRGNPEDPVDISVAGVGVP